MDSYRTVLEVLKYLSPGQVLVSPCSRNWHRACESPELWILLLDQASPAPLPPSSLSPKAQYRKLQASRACRHLLRPSQLSTFHCPTATWQPSIALSAPIKFDLSSALASLYDCSLFACGGGVETSTAWATAYRISEAGAVTPLPPMRSEATFPGVINVTAYVYVFGGKSQFSTHKTAARYNLQGGWEPLPDMLTARSTFNPCCDGQTIYLCGGETPKIDLFDLSSSSFLQLDLTLSSFDSVSTVYISGTVVCVTSTEIITLQSTGKAATHRTGVDFGTVWGNECPVVGKNWVYLPWGQLMQQFDLKSGQREAFWTGKRPKIG